MLQDPGPCIICRHVPHGRLVMLGSEGDKLSMRVVSPVNIIWCVGGVSPNSVATLPEAVELTSQSDGDLKGAHLDPHAGAPNPAAEQSCSLFP